MQRVWRNLNYGLEAFWSYLRQWYQVRNLPQKHVQQHLSAMNIISIPYTVKDPWPPFRNIAIANCEAFKTDTVTAMLNFWKVNIFTRLKSMLLKLLLRLFCFIPCFSSSIRLNNPVRKWGPNPHVSGIPVDLTVGCHGFRPRKCMVAQLLRIPVPSVRRTTVSS